MKFETIIRTQLAIAGLGAALLFAGTASAQEIVNTSFPDGPNVGPFTQPAPEQQAVRTDTDAVFALPGSQAARAMAALAPAEPAPTDPKPSAESWVVGILLAGIAAIALYALAVAKRLTREVRSRTQPYMSSPGV